MFFQNVLLYRGTSSPIWPIFIWAFIRPCLIRSQNKLENIYNSFCQEPFPVLKLNLYHKDEYSRARTVERIKAAGLETALALAESTSLECSAKGSTKA